MKEAMKYICIISIISATVLFGCGSQKPESNNKLTVQKQFTGQTVSPADEDVSRVSDRNTERSADTASISSDTAITEKDYTEAERQESITVESISEENTDYGRILFVGDSRTIDMFYDSDDDIFGEMHDDIVVYGGHAKGLDFMTESVEEYGLENFDTLVSWMGANELGNFEGYGEFYEHIISEGKTLVVCTVGPTDENYIHYDDDGYNYLNSLMQGYNNAMIGWAENNDIRVIDLYSFINDSQTVNADPEDGIHYLPRPTTELWEYIVGELNQ